MYALISIYHVHACICVCVCVCEYASVRFIHALSSQVHLHSHRHFVRCTFNFHNIADFIIMQICGKVLLPRKPASSSPSQTVRENVIAWLCAVCVCVCVMEWNCLWLTLCVEAHMVGLWIWWQCLFFFLGALPSSLMLLHQLQLPSKRVHRAAGPSKASGEIYGCLRF